MLSLRGFLFDLPSNGRGYNGIEFIDGAAVRLTKFVNRDIRTLVTSASSSYKQFQVFLDAVVMEPESLRKNIGQMFVADANTILYAARTLTFGPDYSADYTCKICGFHGQETVSLADSEVKELAVDDPDAVEVSVTTFDKKTNEEKTHELVMGLMRVSDEKVVEQAFKQMTAKKQLQGFEYEKSQLRLAQQIKFIDGDDNNSIESKFFFLDKLTIESVKDLNKTLEDANFGINTTVQIQCRNCGDENEVRLAMSKGFFPA